jgi:hypothetical protein
MTATPDTDNDLVVLTRDDAVFIADVLNLACLTLRHGHAADLRKGTASLTREAARRLPAPSRWTAADHDYDESPLT